VSTWGRHIGRPLHPVSQAADIPNVTHTLLLADDSVTIQRVIELTFADEDVQVIAVGDGDQAIERLEASPPDIVLADIGMPGRNGYEVAQYVKRSPRLSHIPVMLLTGAFEPVDQARASEAGCDGVLAKPFEPQLVISRVKDLLGRSRQTSDVAAAAAADPVAVHPETEPPAADRWSPSAIFDMFASRRQSAAAPEPPAETPSGREAEPTAPQPLDSYFDRLDAAFSKYSSAPQKAPLEPPPGPAPDPFDWFAAKKDSAARAADLDSHATVATEPTQTFEPPAPVDVRLADVSAPPPAHETPEPFASAVPWIADAPPVQDAPPTHDQQPTHENTPTQEAVRATAEPTAVEELPAETAPPDEAAVHAHVALISSDVAAQTPEATALIVEVAASVPEATPPVPEATAWVAEVEDHAPMSTTADAVDAHPDAVAHAPVVKEPTAPSEPAAAPEFVALSSMVEAPAPVAVPPPVATSPIEPPSIRPSAAPVLHALPSLGDAFAALLAAEKAEGLPPTAPAWPSSGPSPALAQEEVVEQVTRRVLHHLSDRIVRETVADLVSAIAERLVREEIERIKSTIR